jgi:hypothetical protein
MADRRLTGFAIATAAVFSATTVSAFMEAKTAVAEPKAVLELFTSQGCSSCPPADKLLGSLRADPAVVTLSLPIDYWDYLGWKDTLADPRNSARQRAYSEMRGDRAVYTPQMVINGVTQALGSDKSEIERIITESHSHGATMTLPVTLALEGNDIVVTPSPAGGKDAVVILCGVAGSVPITIERGENRGKTLTYANVVRHWVELGRLGARPSWRVPLADIKTSGVDKLVALVQAGDAQHPGAMLGAAQATLK